MSTLCDQAKTLEILNNYINHPLLTPEGIDKYITPSTWYERGKAIMARHDYACNYLWGTHLHWLACFCV